MMATHEENVIQRLREELTANKNAAQARADKLLARMAELYERIAAYDKQINDLHGEIGKLKGVLNKALLDNKTLKENQTISDEGYVEKLRELEGILLGANDTESIVQALRFVRRMRGVA